MVWQNGFSLHKFEHHGGRNLYSCPEIRGFCPGVVSLSQQGWSLSGTGWVGRKIHHLFWVYFDVNNRTLHHSTDCFTRKLTLDKLINLGLLAVKSIKKWMIIRPYSYDFSYGYPLIHSYPHDLRCRCHSCRSLGRSSWRRCDNPSTRSRRTASMFVFFQTIWHLTDGVLEEWS